MNSDGEILWSRKVSKRPIYSPVAVNGEDRSIYVAATGEGVYGLTLSGEEKFFYPLEVGSDAELMTHGERVYLSMGRL